VSLPSISELEFETAAVITPATVHRTFDWDFEAGDFKRTDGKLVELTGIDYLKVWINKALRTIRNTLIYVGENYGSEHQSLIGGNFKPDFLRSEMERTIREALLENDAISQVDNFTFAQSGARMEISFTVNSIFGTTVGAVTV
jgi:hypothetical protein